MTEKSEIDLLYEAADIASFDAAKGWPEVLEWDQFFSLMLGHRWLPQLREPQPAMVEYPDGRIEQFGYKPDLRMFDTPETAQKRRASGIIAKMLRDANLKIEERIDTIPQPPKRALVLGHGKPARVAEQEQPPEVKKRFVVTRDAAAACLDAIDKPPPEYVRAWLGDAWQEEAPKGGAGDTVAAKTHALPGIPSSKIIEGFRLPLKNPDWKDKLRHLAAAANHYTKPFDDGLSALVQRGGQGKGSHTWNPARFAVRLIEDEGDRTYSARRASIKNHWEVWLPEFDALMEERGFFDPL